MRSTTLDVSPAYEQPWRPAIPHAARDVARLLVVWVASVLPALIADEHQYTWSLAIFLGPLVLTVSDLERNGALRRHLATVGLSLALLVPMGVVLTLWLADDFFTYPEPRATLGVTLPAFDLEGIDGSVRVPIEELAFYGLGFASLVMLYVWADERLVPMTRPRHRATLPTIGDFARGLALGAIVTLAGWAFAGRQLPPGYLSYLMLVPLPVLAACGPLVAHRINWTALAFVCLALWGHSVVWEVTLAIPQGWWGYQPSAMLGVEIAAWHHLPIEAVLVWLMTPVAAVVSLETLRAAKGHLS